MVNLGVSKSFDLGDGRIVSIETGKIAKQAHGSVVLKMGNTMLLATVVSNKEVNNKLDYLPLSVDYREKYSAMGKFPGGFFKREARPSDYEILISRLVDRAIRPLFPKDYHSDTIMSVSLISGEKDVAPDALVALAASAALTVSDIPFAGPISEVRVAKVDGEFVINPSVSDTEKADMEFMVAASMDNIMMVEGECKEISEEEMIEALAVAHEAIKKQCQVQLDLAELVEASKVKREYCHEENDEELNQALINFTYDKLFEIAISGKSKHERKEAFAAVREEFAATIDEEERAGKMELVKKYFHDVEKEAVRNAVLKKGIRLDGRKLDEVRPIWVEMDYMPSAHGSAVFTRGETQAMVSVTLGTKMDEQIVDGVIMEGKSNFYLHYNFPSFCTGEARMNRGTSRREIGHGNLAMRALKNMLPEKENNPYTIRIMSDIMESNGSSSMASVCGGSLALMDAGIKIKKPVSGIAMGLISDSKTGEYAILTDILGDEDHLGDMDFKVTGTKDGITACQMDIKVDGLSFEILTEALTQAKKARLEILDKMNEAMPETRDDYKDFVPRIEKVIIPKEFIGAVIGPGGKVIQEIQLETATTIIIEEDGDTGIIDIAAANKDSIEKAKARIKSIVAVPEVGEVYDGTVKNIQSFGAFIEILPGKDGMVHISEIDWKRINNIEDVLKIGDKVKVKLIDVDRKTGKLRLSRKVLLPKPVENQ